MLSNLLRLVVNCLFDMEETANADGAVVVNVRYDLDDDGWD